MKNLGIALRAILLNFELNASFLLGIDNFLGSFPKAIIIMLCL